MAAIQRTHVEVYLFRRRRGRVQFLCLRRSPGRKLGGVWQPVTGKVDRGETALAAAVREAREETGIAPTRFWALETVTVYYDPGLDSVMALPLFAAEAAAAARVRISGEHDAYAWLSARAAGNRFLWEAQRAGLAAVRREVLLRPRLARALEVPLPARRKKQAAKRAGRPGGRARAKRRAG